jgi:hypothetical protein
VDVTHGDGIMALKHDHQHGAKGLYERAEDGHRHMVRKG